MNNIYLGLGSNLGDKLAHLHQAIDIISHSCQILQQSPWYQTAPVGYLNQDWFINGALEINTDLPPLDLLHFLQSIETKLKRVRTLKNGPRTIDLDLLFYGNQVINTRELTLPHPRLTERLFVLVPLNDIASNFIHPIEKKTISKLLKRLLNSTEQPPVGIQRLIDHS